MSTIFPARILQDHAKHTPGPWRWVRSFSSTGTEYWDERTPLGKLPDLDHLCGIDPLQHCVLSGVWHNDSTAGIGLNGDNPDADARLIAAAPELLDALKAARQELIGLSCYLETCAPHVIINCLPTTVANMKAKIRTVEAAIVKAGAE